MEIDAHGHPCQAQMLKFPEIAFFDPLNPEKLLCRLWVHTSAYSKGRWRKIDKKPIPDYLAEEVPRFKKDHISGKISIHINGNDYPASYNDCVNLECAAVWDANHVEDRLRDHCEDKENIWVKSMSIENDA